MGEQTEVTDCDAGLAPARRDRGISFIEVLVAVVLLGLGGVATLAALRVSISGSDQHRSKVAALSELEGAAAYLTYHAAGDANFDCDPTVAVGDVNAVLTARTIPAYTEMSVTATSVDCSSGTAQVSLLATHDRGNAVESLDVVVGGISIFDPGDGTSSPPPPTCVWSSATATPDNVSKSGNQLSQPITITIGLSGTTCPTSGVTATITRQFNGASFSRTMTLSGGVFVKVLAVDEISPWPKDTYDVTIDASSVPVGTTSFVVL